MFGWKCFKNEQNKNVFFSDYLLKLITNFYNCLYESKFSEKSISEIQLKQFLI